MPTVTVVKRVENNCYIIFFFTSRQELDLRLTNKSKNQWQNKNALRAESRRSLKTGSLFTKRLAAFTARLYKYMCFNLKGDISPLNGGSLKLVDKFIYLGSSISFTESTIKCFQLLLSNTYNSVLLIHLHRLKWFQVLLCVTNNSIKHQSFVYTQLNDQTVQFLTIQFSISHLFVLSLNVKQFYSTHR